MIDRSPAARALAAALAVLAGCYDTVPGAPASASEAGVPDVRDVPVDRGPSGPPPETEGIGEPCRPDPSSGERGTCAAGQVCLGAHHGFVNGYCARRCVTGSACPAGALCLRVPAFGTACLRRCDHDADCRGVDGYRCAGLVRDDPPGCVPDSEPVGRRANGAACFTTTAGAANHRPALARGVFAEADVEVSALPGSVAAAEGNVALAPRAGAVATTYIAVVEGWPAMGVTRRAADGALAATRVPDPEYRFASDPVLATLRDGALGMAFVGANLEGAAGSHVRFTTSADGGATWAPARAVDPPGFCARTVCDKPWIAAGPSVTAPGREALYVTYLQASSATLVVQRSDDGGATWSAPVPVAERDARDGTSVNLAQLAVGRDGALVATWLRIVGRHGAGANRVQLRRSTTGGATWEPARDVSHPGESVVPQQAPVAVDGALAVVAYVRGDARGAWDVVLATSEDRGATWARRVVNDEGEACATHALPALAMDPAGDAVHVAWLDNRFGDGAAAYARCPRDPGLSCGRNEAVGRAAFRFSTTRDPFLWHGDYLGLAAGSDGALWMAWSDTRAGNPAMFLARGRSR